VRWESQCFWAVGLIWLWQFIFAHRVQNRGFMSAVWFVCGMNCARDSVLNGLGGAWSVCGGGSTSFDGPSFSRLILMAGSLRWMMVWVQRLCGRAGGCTGFLRDGSFGLWF